jgi:hypothetical protein
VAETENPAIRKISLKEQQVETVMGKAGQRKSSREISFTKGDLTTLECHLVPDQRCGHGASTVKSRRFRRTIWIAMAGIHQIWALFL